MKTIAKLIAMLLVLASLASCSNEQSVSTGFQCDFEPGSFGFTNAAFGNENIHLEGTLVMSTGVFYVGLYDADGKEVYSSVFNNSEITGNNHKTYFIDVSLRGKAGVYSLQYESTGAGGSINLKLHN